MLMEIARGLQLKPRSAQQLHDALALYQRALTLVPESGQTGDLLLAARIRAREGTAHQALPDGGVAALDAAQECYEQARTHLLEYGLPEELAELDMNLGLIVQSQASLHRAKIQDAIAHYHRALRVFNRARHPREYAILHNNLAIAYLSIPTTDETGKLREALAVQSFEQVLEVITLIDHPTEYAMAQNNLGNALQYAPSSHPVANLLRAIEAYDEALKVRTPRDMPIEYANTIANKANALRNLPDDPEHPEAGHARNLGTARTLLTEAHALFAHYGMAANAASVAEAIADLATPVSFGESLVPSPKEMH
jgi:tetratricopeptide (TPR) repeat protein